MAGGKMYIESSNIASDYNGSEIGEYLGINLISSGNENEVNYLAGASGSMASGLHLNYTGGESPHYQIDRILSVGEIMFACEEDFGRVSMYKNSTYNVATSSVVMGAMANGDSLNLKAYYVAELVYDLLDFDPSVSITEIAGNVVCLTAYPNPSHGEVSLNYLIQKQGRVTINILDEAGRIVQTVFDGLQNAGTHQIIWDGKNETGAKAKAGIYFYSIQSNQHFGSGKIIMN